MSLDVYLEAEVDTGGDEPYVVTVFDANVTHNLARMADEAGIYEHLWRPDEIGIETAAQLAEPLRAGLRKMEDDPERFKALNPPNGYGSYADFMPWVREYLAACIEHPKAKVRVWR
jgi:hypothetical protein